MVNEIIFFGAVFLSGIFMVLGILGKNKEDYHDKLVFLSLSAFIGIGGVYLSYQELVPFYAYIPLSFTIVSIIYAIYVVYLIISDKKDWGDEVDEGMNADFIKG